MSYNPNSIDMNGMTGADYANLAQQSINDKNKQSLQSLNERVELLENKIESLLEIMNLKWDTSKEK